MKYNHKIKHTNIRKVGTSESATSSYSLISHDIELHKNQLEEPRSLRKSFSYYVIWLKELDAILRPDS